MTKKKLLSSLEELQNDGLITEEAALEAQKRLTAKKRHTGRIFTVIGAVIAAAGIIITFAALWEEIPALLIKLLTFLPLLIGAASGAFAITKEKANPILNESASVIWCAGVAAVLAAAGSSAGGGLNISFNTELVIALFALIILPVAFVLKSIAPLIAANAAALFMFYDFYAFDDITEFTILLTAFASFAAAVIFAVLARKDCTYRGIASRWLSIAAAVIFTAIFVNYIYCRISIDLHPGVLAAPVLALLLLISLKRDELAEPFKITGTVGAVVLTFITASVPCFYSDTTIVGGIGDINKPLLIIAACISALVTVCLGVIYTLKNKNGILNSVPAISVIASAILLTLDTFIISFIPETAFFAELIDELYIIGGSALTAALCACLIISGLKEFKYARTNLGIAGAVTLIIMWFSESILSPVFIGMSLIIFGAGIIAANIRIAKGKKLKKTLDAIITTDEGSESK